jgi:hypothetical protein
MMPSPSSQLEPIPCAATAAVTGGQRAAQLERLLAGSSRMSIEQQCGLCQMFEKVLGHVGRMGYTPTVLNGKANLAASLQQSITACWEKVTANMQRELGRM